MKFFKITVFSFFALAACGSLRAQDLRGVVRDAENQPLVGASVYWAGTYLHNLLYVESFLSNLLC